MDSADKIKGKIYMGVFFLAALTTGWFLVARYKPVVVASACSEVALESSKSYRRNILTTEEEAYNELYYDCINDLESSSLSALEQNQIKR